VGGGGRRGDGGRVVGAGQDVVGIERGRRRDRDVQERARGRRARGERGDRARAAEQQVARALLDVAGQIEAREGRGRRDGALVLHRVPDLERASRSGGP